MSAEEAEEREEVLAEVVDPAYLMGRDGEGEVEVDGGGDDDDDKALNVTSGGRGVEVNGHRNGRGQDGDGVKFELSGGESGAQEEINVMDV